MADDRIWEYRWVPVSDGAPTREHLGRWNALGEKGWELVATTAGGGGVTTGLIFKRGATAALHANKEGPAAIRARSRVEEQHRMLDPLAPDPPADDFDDNSDPTASWIFRKK